MPEPTLWFDSPTLINILTRVAVTAAPAYRLRDVTIDVSQALLVVAAIVIVFIDLIVVLLLPTLVIDPSDFPIHGISLLGLPALLVVDLVPIVVTIRPRPVIHRHAPISAVINCRLWVECKFFILVCFKAPKKLPILFLVAFFQFILLALFVVPRDAKVVRSRQNIPRPELHVLAIAGNPHGLPSLGTNVPTWLRYDGIARVAPLLADALPAPVLPPVLPLDSFGIPKLHLEFVGHICKFSSLWFLAVGRRMGMGDLVIEAANSRCWTVNAAQQRLSCHGRGKEGEEKRRYRCSLHRYRYRHCRWPFPSEK